MDQAWREITSLTIRNFFMMAGLLLPNEESSLVGYPITGVVETLWDRANIPKRTKVSDDFAVARDVATQEYPSRDVVARVTIGEPLVNSEVEAVVAPKRKADVGANAELDDAMVSPRETSTERALEALGEVMSFVSVKGLPEHFLLGLNELQKAIIQNAP